MPEVLVSMTAGGVTLVLESPVHGLPVVRYWGAALDDLAAPDLPALVAAQVPVPGTNQPDAPVRVAVLPEHHAGWVGRPGLIGSRAGRDWAPRFVVRTVRLDGGELTGDRTSGAGRLTLHAEDDELALGLDLEVELTADGLVRQRATVHNRGAAPYGLEALEPGFPVPERAVEILDFAGRHELERIPQRGAVVVGSHRRENRRGRTGADSAYLLHVGEAGFGFGAGEVWAVHTAWSGDHVHAVERVFTGETVLSGGELLLPGEIVLDPDGSYTSPWLYGSYGVGLDAVARRLHRHQRRTGPGPDRPVTLNVWEAVYFDHDLGRLTALADHAAAVGVERFVLDDGWFGARRDDRAGLGDWVVSPDVWPDGLHPLVDHVHRLGMQFGLWVEPEMINLDSELARAHPDWVLAARRDPPPESRYQQVLDLANPDAFAWIHARLSDVLAEYDIAYLKWDHNRDLVEAGTPPRVHAQTAAFYRLLDALRAEHPGLEIESCSSGGARVDLGVLERTDRVWVSDDIDPLERQHMLRWTTQLLAPEYLGSHIASGRSHTTGRRHDLAFRAGTAVFGHLGVEWDLTEASPAERAELAAWIAWWRTERGFLLTGDVVRMDGYPDEVLVHGVLAPDRSRAVVAMAALRSPTAVRPPTIRVRGLDPHARYRVTPLVVGNPPSGLRPPPWWSAGGTELSGRALETLGVAAPAVHPEQVVLVLAERTPTCSDEHQQALTSTDR